MRSQTWLSLGVMLFSILASVAPLHARAAGNHGRGTHAVASQKTPTPRTKRTHRTPTPTPTPTRTKPPVGNVRWILRGLTVQPQHKRAVKGHVKQNLNGGDLLRTIQREKASIGFHDGTVLHMNQNTDAVLRTPNITYVSHGEVDEVLVPGTNHKIVTPDAVAAAVGTEFDVKLVGKKTIITVIEGALRVTGQNVTRTVKTSQQVTIVTGKPPSKPKHVDTTTTTAWAQTIPPPTTPIPRNIGLDANGGHVVSASSEAAGPGAWYTRQTGTSSPWAAKYINDGSLTRGWASETGKTSNQSVIVGFANNLVYEVEGVVLDPAATAGHPESNDLHDFAILVSTSNTAPGSFHEVLRGWCAQRLGLQRFTFPAPIKARYVELLALDNYGGPNIDVAEFAVVAPGGPVPTDTPPPPTATPLPAATDTPIPVYTMAPTATVAATATPVPTATSPPTITPLPAPTLRVVTPVPSGPGTSGSFGASIRSAQANYAPGQGVELCYSVTSSGTVVITITTPGGSVVTAYSGQSNGAGGCISAGPFSDGGNYGVTLNLLQNGRVVASAGTSFYVLSQGTGCQSPATATAGGGLSRAGGTGGSCLSISAGQSTYNVGDTINYTFSDGYPGPYTITYTYDCSGETFTVQTGSGTGPASGSGSATTSCLGNDSLTISTDYGSATTTFTVIGGSPVGVY